MFCNGLGPTWLSSVMSAPSRVWAAQLPNHSSGPAWAASKTFHRRTNFFSALCVCVRLCVIGSSQILQSFVMQMPGCLVCLCLLLKLFELICFSMFHTRAPRWQAAGEQLAAGLESTRPSSFTSSPPPSQFFKKSFLGSLSNIRIMS